MFKPAPPRPDVFGMSQDHALNMMNKSAWDSKQYSIFTGGNLIGTLTGQYTALGVVTEVHIYMRVHNYMRVRRITTCYVIFS